MGPPTTGWRDIPQIHWEVDSLHGRVRLGVDQKRARDHNQTPIKAGVKEDRWVATVQLRKN